MYALGTSGTYRVEQYVCELKAVTNITNGVKIEIYSYDQGYESGSWRSWSLAFNYMIVLN